MLFAAVLSSLSPKAHAAESGHGAPGSGESTSATKRTSAELVPASDFLTPRPVVAPEDARKREELQRLTDQLEAGRKHRVNGENESARATLIPLLEGEAPADVQQAALIELALTAEQEKEFSRAQQIYNQFQKRFSDSPLNPEILLRQGLMYREMGAPTLALAKFYAVGASALQLKEGNLERYRRIVLQAQTEIANTYFLQGKYEEAVDFFQRLLKQETVDLHRAQIYYRLVQCQERLGRTKEVEFAAREFLKTYADTTEAPEVRFLLANALKQMGRNRDMLQEVSHLLVSQQEVGKTNRASWAYWQQRAGNEIANQLYQEGDYPNALEVYEGLLPLSPRFDWQLPLLYQIGLTYEKLAQAPRAEAAYRQVLAKAAEGTTNVTSGLRSVVEMARWRASQLQWQVQAERTNVFYSTPSKAKTLADGGPVEPGTEPAVKKP